MIVATVCLFRFHSSAEEIFWICSSTFIGQSSLDYLWHVYHGYKVDLDFKKKIRELDYNMLLSIATKHSMAVQYNSCRQELWASISRNILCMVFGLLLLVYSITSRATWPSGVGSVFPELVFVLIRIGLMLHFIHINAILGRQALDEANMAYPED
jgi:hypothetical protein